MKAFGGRGTFAVFEETASFSCDFIVRPVEAFFGDFDIASWDATETAEPENAGVRMRRKAHIDTSIKPTTGAPMSALLPSVSLYIEKACFSLLPESRLDLLNIFLADHVSHIGWKKNFVICRCQVTQGVLPKELCNCAHGFNGWLHGVGYSSHFVVGREDVLRSGK